MTKREIIEIVQAMDHNQDYRSYYQFAHTYLRHMKNTGNTDAGTFWNVIRHCQAAAESKNTIQAMGSTGNGRPADIVRWCKYLLNNRYLADAGTDDLLSIFGYCAHLGR